MIKRLVLFIMLSGLLIAFIFAMTDLELIYNDFGKQYFLTYGLMETGSRNLVTGIYLDYRLFDSIFEAGILLIAVSGVMWISQHKIQEKNANFMLDKQKTPELFVTFSRLLYPVMLMFGFYVIINGHLSPGGGFQGGAIVATAILILYYIDLSKTIDVKLILTIEKILFIVLVLVGSLSLLTTDGYVFTNFIAHPDYRQVYLMILNVLIGIKVALGLTAIFTAFLKEGR
ncbi:MAG: MnhB domain-containing protein [Acholeplasmataceae bacterium]